MRRTTLFGLGGAFLLSLLSCSDEQPELISASKSSGQPAHSSVGGIPFPGPLSRHAPPAGPLSNNAAPAEAVATSWPGYNTVGTSLGSAQSLAFTPPDVHMLWQHASTGERSIWLMSGASWSGSASILPAVPTAWTIAGSGDFNLDQFGDILWQNTSTGERSIWYMSGSNYTQ